MTKHDQLVENLAKHLQKQLEGQRGETQTPSPPGETASDASVSIIRTHISSVILAGEYAYKIKRAVKFAFLDFSTLDKRQAQCLRELAVNQRAAPQIYLDVLPITGSTASPALNGSTGPVIEWAVKMRRFETGMLLSELARDGQLSSPQIEDLARYLARFHLTSPIISVNDLTQGDRRPAHKTTQQWLLESLNEIEACLQPETPSGTRGSAYDTKILIEQIDALRTETSKAWDETLALRTARQAQGWVRECHGDLHLNNITLSHGQPVIFDAIEFNDDLRQIDLVNELAFPFMDLLAHGLSDLAWTLTNEYEQVIGDYRGLALLKYYTRYRAIVRAKVALLTQKVDDRDHGAQTYAFQRYWEIALNPPFGTRPAPLILVAGLSGSGKSTVARMLSRQIGAVWLRADFERKRLFPETDSERRYSPEATDLTYKQLEQHAHELLNAGLSVVIDATFLDKKQVARFEALSLTASNKRRPHALGNLILIVCESDRSVMQDRITQRRQTGIDPSEASVEVLQHQVSQIRSGGEPWPATALRIVNNGSLQALQSTVTRLVSGLNDKRLAGTDQAHFSVDNPQRT